MGLFYKPKTVGQVAEEFPRQQAFLKTYLLKSWLAASGIHAPYDYDAMSEDELETATYIGQCLNYLFAEDPDSYGNADAQQIERIKRIRRVLPGQSREAMSNNKDLRRIIVYTLRMRLYLHTMLEGTQWIRTPEGKRTWDTLNIYGGEFPEEVTDKMFDKLVRQCTRQSLVMNTKAKRGK